MTAVVEVGMAAPTRRTKGTTTSALTTLRTDMGNAERFVTRHGADVRYVAEWRRWFVWDGKRWGSDDTLEVNRRAKETIRSMWPEVAAIDTSGEKEDWVKHIMRSEGESRLRAMLECAKSEPSIVIRPSQMDADPWLLNVANGVLDLRTAELQPHDRALLMTKFVPAPYDPEARCDRWEAFLRRIMDGNQDVIEFLQRAVGYSLTGVTGERCLFFLYGMGANGKSTFLEVIRHLLSGYAQQADFTSFLERQGEGPRNDIARLFGARVVTSSEVGEGKRLNESLVKTLTGDDTITARFLHAEFFEFRPQFKLWLAANHRPVIRGTDSAIWTRVRLIPFTVSIPAAERDLGLKDALFDELPGILAWAAAGCLFWRERGLGAPAKVAEATEQYRRDSDTLGTFLDECCAVEIGNPDLATPATFLYSAYKRWADQGGEYQLSQTAFGRRLEERGITAEKRGRGSDRLKWRLGVRILDVPAEQSLFSSHQRSSANGNAASADARERYSTSNNNDREDDSNVLL